MPHWMARAVNFMLCASSHNWRRRCLSHANSSLCVFLSLICFHKTSLSVQSPSSWCGAAGLSCWTSFCMRVPVIRCHTPGWSKTEGRSSEASHKQSRHILLFKKKTRRILYQVSQPWEDNQARNTIFMADKPSSVMLEWHQTLTILTYS